MEVIVQLKNPPAEDDLKNVDSYSEMKKLFNGIKSAQVTLLVTNTHALKSDPAIACISPGNHPYVIAAAATNAKGTATEAGDTIASYSPRGPRATDHLVKPGLVAPANTVVSPLASKSCTPGLSPRIMLLDTWDAVGLPGTGDARRMKARGDQLWEGALNG